MRVTVKGIESVIINARGVRIIINEDDGESMVVEDPKMVENYLLGILLYELRKFLPL